MKKSIAILLIFVLVLFCVGCNHSKQDDGNNSSVLAANEQDETDNLSTDTTDITSSTQENEDYRGVSSESKSTEETSKTTENVDIPSKMELNKLGNLSYYLYSPSNPTENMPLIIYLHGGTNKKLAVTELLTIDSFPKYLYDGYYGDLRAYVAVPKLENSYRGWSDIYEQIRTLIKALNTEYKINMDKIALTGHSMGGTGTYQLQVKLPNTFACIAPMSGSIPNTEMNVSALSKTKIWAFVGTADTVVKPESTQTIISVLKEKGADAKLTELNKATHFDVPSLAYKDEKLINWLVNCGEG